MKESIITVPTNQCGRRSPILAGCLGMLAAVALILAGCGRSGADANANDSQMEATLAQLTTELHHTMAGRKINRNFDEFVALSKVEVPPPPAGKKYAINDKWKVVLVNQ